MTVVVDPTHALVEDEPCLLRALPRVRDPVDAPVPLHPAGPVLAARPAQDDHGSAVGGVIPVDQPRDVARLEVMLPHARTMSRRLQKKRVPSSMSTTSQQPFAVP